MYIIAGQEDPSADSIWKSSPNWAATDWTSWELTPHFGTKLRITKTILSAGPGFKQACEGVEIHYRGILLSLLPEYVFDRVYSTFLDYAKACDEYYEYPDGSCRFVWHYTGPRRLSSAHGSSVRLDKPAGFGCDAYLTMKCLTEAE